MLVSEVKRIGKVGKNTVGLSARSLGNYNIIKLLEKFGGGGHALASGAKLPSFEEVDDLIKALDILCKEQIYQYLNMFKA